MKHLLVLLLLTGTLYARAQRANHEDPLTESFRGKVKSVRQLTFEAAGDSLNVIKMQRREDFRSSHERVYDSLGKMQSIQYLSSADIPLEKIVFAYDTKGHVLQEQHFLAGGKKGRSFIRTFDKKGMKLTEVEKNDSQKVVFKGDYVYKSGQLMVETEQDGNGNCIKKVEYKRDRKGNVLQETWYDSDCKTVVSRVEVHYNKKGELAGTKALTPEGNLISSKKYLYDHRGKLVERRDFDKDTNLMQRLTYVYDEKNRLAEEMVIDRKGNIKKKMIHSFDAQGRVNMEYRYRNDAETQESQELWAYYTFDAYNNVTERKMVRSGTANANTERMEYEFDKQGNWIKRVSFRGPRPFLVEERILSYY